MSEWISVDLSEPFRFERYSHVDEIPDGDWHEYPLERVERYDGGWEIGFDGCYVTGIADELNTRGVVPRIGDLYRFYGDSWGPNRGRAIAGQVLWYETPEEHRDRTLRELAERKRLERERFYASEHDDYVQRRDALPEVFRERITKREANNPDFDWEYGQYELFCCEQALLIANALGTVEAIETFYGQDWDQQKQTVPGLDEGHSGNTFGCACSLARWYLANPSQVPLMYGALSPLVGSAAYGDLAPEEMALAEAA